MTFANIQARCDESNQCHLDKILGRGIVLLLWIANIYDMGGGFGIKYVSFAVALLYLVLNFRSFPMDRLTSHIFICVFLLWPILSLLRGVVAGADLALVINQISAFPAAIVFFLVIQSVRPQYGVSVFFSTMCSLAVAIIALYSLMWFGNPLADYLLKIFSSEAHGYIGYRPFGNVLLPNVYFKATLFLVPTYIYFLYSAKSIKALVVLLALVLAFSKAGFTICLLFTLVYLILHRGDRRFKTAIIALFLLLSPWFLSFGQFTEELVQSLTGQSETAQVRVGYIDSLYTMFGENPSSLLIGQGPGSVFYAQNQGDTLSNIELDHLNAIRKFGLPWFLVFTAFVLVLSYKLFGSKFSDDRVLGLALFAIFLAAGTNPVLLSPPFLMFMAMLLDFYWRRHETAC